MPGMHAAGDDAVPKGIRRDDASAARPKKKSSADATQTPPLARAPDVMMTFDGENWVPRRSSFDASSI